MNQSLSTETLQQILTDIDSAKLPSSETLVQMLTKAKEIVNEEATVVRINGNVSVIGNICGQFWDFKEALKHTGLPSEKNHLLVLGDLANRSDTGVEVIVKLIALKLLHPSHVTILRGKFEHIKLCEIYGYQKEVEDKFQSLDVAKASYAFFDVLPIAAIVNNSVFCVHGGLSPDIKTIADIEKLDRKQETPMSGPMTDLIWSDPIEDQVDDFAKNPRGAGWTYGKNPVDAFLKENNLSLMVRSHQLQNEGYAFNHNDQTLTIFSAANYCGQCENRGAVLKIDAGLHRTIICYTASAESLEATRKSKEEALAKKAAEEAAKKAAEENKA